MNVNSLTEMVHELRKVIMNNTNRELSHISIPWVLYPPGVVGLVVEGVEISCNYSSRWMELTFK